LTLREGEHGCRLREGRLEIGLAGSGGWRERALDWIWGQALAFFHGRIEAMSQRHGLRVSSVGISNAQTRWGSCAAAGRILLSWRLMLLPPHIVDYVVAHELAHLRELNHSPRFWEVVGRLYPSYHSARRELSSLARSLPNL
jgi:predicted metal-dependent hydrolase